ncbi:TEX261-like protein [Brachionus plicatilis]|uniref:Protein TEX261 n=1 Tax=Brachionus plicatilis TaxID=10195 RepID=A0A3M7QRH0_BRAPC|nr:TEX261-like protein [Brachionus plicatilis]
MWYLYLLSWLSIIIQSALITFSIGAGLYYLAEIVEEYASAAKKVIFYAIAIDTFLALGLWIFEDLPSYLMITCILCNLLYYLSVRNFPIVNVTSIEFILSIILFMLHNYEAFSHFTSIYYEFNIVLCYMTIFCWLIPIGLLVSCSANDNVLPTTYSSDRENDNLVTSYFKTKGRKIGFLSLMRYFNKNYLPTIQSRKSY